MEVKCKKCGEIVISEKEFQELANIIGDKLVKAMKELE